MDKEQIKNDINFDRIEEVSFPISDTDEIVKIDYLMGSKGNAIAPLSPFEVKLIEYVKKLRADLDKMMEVVFE